MNLVLDVSNTNEITEQLLRRSGAVALIAKATEGTTFQDKTYLTHREVALAAHVPFGGFLFLHPHSEGSEADHFVEYAFPVRGRDIQPIVDCEVTDGAPMLDVALRCLSCLKRLRALGYDPIVYSDGSFLRKLIAVHPGIARYRVWEASYPGRFTRWTPQLAGLRYKLRDGAGVAMWQWTSVYTVGDRKYDASRLMVPLRSLLIPGSV